MKKHFSSMSRIFRDEPIEYDPDTGEAVVVNEIWKEEGLLHRDNGPAGCSRDAKTGIVIFEVWARNGLPHRDDGPAIIIRNAASGEITSASWFSNGRNIEDPTPENQNPGVDYSP